MVGLLALFAAALLAEAGAPPPDGAAGQPRAGLPLDFTADSGRYDASKNLYLLSGHAVLRRGDGTVRAPEASYDADSGEIVAPEGGLYLSPGRALYATRLRMSVDGPFEANDALLYLKPTAADLSGARTIAEARALGRNRLTLRARFAEGPSGERFDAQGVRLTLCDCGDAPPAWEIRASSAHVVMGDHATLAWPVIYVTPRFLFLTEPVPVLPLPWLYLPLGDRQTGLLIPQLSSASTTGTAISQPLYLVLGRSADATITADYAFGAGPGAGRSVQGPGSSLELRWAPAADASGQLRVTWLHDLGHDTDFLPSGPVFSPPHGERYALQLRHAESWNRTDFAADVSLVGDPSYLQDFTYDVLLRGAQYGRSAASLAWRGDNLVLEADAAYFEPLANLDQQAFPVDPVTHLPRVDYGFLGSRIPWMQRVSASAELLPVSLAGPVSLSGSFGLARFAPMHGFTGDEGLNGIGPGDVGWGAQVNPANGQCVTDPRTGACFRSDAGEGDGIWQPGERLAATRASLRAELQAPLSLGRFLLFEPWVRGAALGYAFDAAQPARLSAYGVAGATLSTQVSRTYGSGDGRIAHLVEPRIEWRGGSGLAGGPLPAYGYDDLDGAPIAPGAPCTDGNLPFLPVVPGRACLPLRSLSAIPQGPWSQMRVALRNRLVKPGGSLSQSTLDLDFGQDFDLGAGMLSETFARGSLATGPAQIDVLARFYSFGAKPPPGTWQVRSSSWLDGFTELRANVTVADARGDNLHGWLLALGSGGSSDLRAGVEPLFDTQPIPLEALSQASAGAKAHAFADLDVTADILFNVRTMYAPQTGAVPPHLQQTTFGLVWAPPCHCLTAQVGLTFADWGRQFFAKIDLSELTNARFGP